MSQVSGGEFGLMEGAILLGLFFARMCSAAPGIAGSGFMEALLCVRSQSESFSSMKSVQGYTTWLYFDFFPGDA